MDEAEKLEAWKGDFVATYQELAMLYLVSQSRAPVPAEPRYLSLSVHFAQASCAQGGELDFEVDKKRADELLIDVLMQRTDAALEAGCDSVQSFGDILEDILGRDISAKTFLIDAILEDIEDLQKGEMHSNGKEFLGCFCAGLHKLQDDDDATPTEAVAVICDFEFH